MFENMTSIMFLSGGRIFVDILNQNFKYDEKSYISWNLPENVCSAGYADQKNEPGNVDVDENENGHEDADKI